MKTPGGKRIVFRGPVGFTPAESRIAAVMAVVVVGAMGIGWYQRSVLPAGHVQLEKYALSAKNDAQAPTGDTQAAADTGGEAVRSSVGARIDLNTADYAELVRLPGIGPVLAGRIIEHRDRQGPFRSVDSLLAVSGIGVKKLNALRPYLCVQ